MTPAIKTLDLSFRYPGKEKRILKKINLEVQKGEILAVIGLSGSGKTSLCYCLSGIIPHIYKGNLSGEVYIQGEPVSGLTIPEIATKVGIVFQNPETQVFFPVVEDELAFGPENLCVKRDEIAKRIKRVLGLLDLEDIRYAESGHLSGGQKQLVALASVLTLEPDILIFDEVMSQIDNQGRERIKEVILQLKSEGKTVVMIEHNLKNIDIADRRLVLKKGRLHEFAGKL
ncbi:MAG: energy-coupling factor ABC transporter ATP-binding protein [Halanaerobiaceae bacterium]